MSLQVSRQQVLKDSKDRLGHILVRGLGIREEEYDDEEDAMAFLNDSMVYLSADRALIAYDQEYTSIAEERIFQRNREYAEQKRRQEEILKEKIVREQRESEIKKLEKEEKILKSREEGKKQIAAYLARRRIDKDDLRTAEMEIERRRLIEQQHRKQEEEAAARALAEQREKLEAAARAEREKLEAEKIAQQLKEAAELQQKQREADEAAANKLIASSTIPTVTVLPPTPLGTTATPRRKGLDVPPEFQNAVLSSDLQKYLKSQQLLSDYKEKFTHLSARGCKEYYFAALKAVNTPLNALSRDSIQEKLTQFVNLLEGKHISLGESTIVNFSARSQPEGELFVSSLFAFRFVKKSESEISKGHDNVAPLAILGVALAQRFPAWAILVRANFFKMCPFLVPFSFPQNNMSIEEYAKAMGHDVSGSDNSVRQALLDKMTGYVTLYCLMVKYMDQQKAGAVNMGEIAEFFSIKEVWRILVATMKLKPQVDITATVLRIMLETLGNRLSTVYRVQFQKLIQLVIKSFLPIIRRETPQGRQAAVTRLELLLETKLQTGF